MSDNTALRSAEINRATAETTIRLQLTLGGDGVFTGSSGIGFFDHMLTLLARHGHLGLELDCTGDLQVDGHHTVEDVGICLGSALNDALGDKRGIARYGFAYVPMDECLARAVLDLSGRTHIVIDAQVESSSIGTFDTDLAWEFFQALGRSGKMNLHVDLLRSGNAHHAVEACFKAFAHALAQAVAYDGGSGVPSTKGVL